MWCERLFRPDCFDLRKVRSATRLSLDLFGREESSGATGIEQRRNASVAGKTGIS
jgi:hypothetical protein